MLFTLLLLQTLTTPTTVARGPVSGIEMPRQVVIRTAEDWSALWRAHQPTADTPPMIDFSNAMVVGIFLGTRPTAGFSVTITAVRMDGDRRVVEYVERRPGPADIVAQMLTSPFHLVSIPRDPARVEFRNVGRESLKQ